MKGRQASSGVTRPLRSILLCGASVRSLAESAIAAGLRPLCVDFFEDDDLIGLLNRRRGRFVGRINSFAELPKLTHSVRSSIPMLWAGGLENHTDILRVISRRRHLVGASPDIVEAVRDPFRLHSWLTAAGLSVPRLASQSTADANCVWLRKPMGSAGGMGIRKYKNTVPDQHRNLIHSFDSDTERTLLTSPVTTELHHVEYLQEYIDGVPMSAVCSVIDNELQLCGMSLQLTGWPSLGASGFLFCGNVGPVDPGDNVTRQVMQAATTIAAHSGLTGVFGMDFILHQGRAWFLEVNPRLTSSHMLYEQQYPGQLLRMHAEAFGVATTLRNTDHSAWTRSITSAVAARLIVWANADFLVPGDMNSSLNLATSPLAKAQDIPKSGTMITVGNPICSVFVTGLQIESIESLISGLEPPEIGTWRLSWQAVGKQIQLQRERFERNLRVQCAGETRL